MFAVGLISYFDGGNWKYRVAQSEYEKCLKYGIILNQRKTKYCIPIVKPNYHTKIAQRLF